MIRIVSSTFDIAHWFLQRGELARTFISPLKLQRLLYLSQAHYAGLHKGQPLMPSVFVVSEVGPLEPNIHRAIENEPPKVSVRDIPEEVIDFVEMIWGKYGSTKIDALNRLVMQDPAFKEAEMEEGMQAIISLDAMQRYYAPQKPVAKAKDIPDKLPDEIPILLPIFSLPHVTRRAKMRTAKAVTRVTETNLMLPGFRV
jgi:uncharacterized phage-associated protein